ncbi:NAD(P)-dependent oxidoreductase [Streptomyces sp. NPDC018964]|uniref:NAD(P)-dependent oxidoreductase n=1 Tax=Streptomyces sp. NPDC018964 TaxID=3365058 RepID=UPI0037BB8D8F
MTDSRVVWLPRKVDDESFGGSLDVHYWDGGDVFPSDPAKVGFLAPPLEPGRERTVLKRILPRVGGIEVLQLLSSGYEYLRPFLPLLPAGARVATGRGVHGQATAEHATALLLAMTRGLDVFQRRQQRGEWRPSRFSTLLGKTVLVLGQGAVGGAVASRLAPFGCHVVRVARSARDTSEGRVHAIAELHDLLPEADAVVVCVPLAAGTRGLLGSTELSLLPDGAVVVNVARGEIVDTPALVEEVATGRLRAGLDVTAPEPLPSGHPLWGLPGALVTPHTAAFTDAFDAASAAFLSRQVHRYARGEALLNALTLPEAAEETP